MSRDSLPPVLPIVWSEQAESDLLEIASYINEQSPQNALAMVGRLQAAVQPLRRFPRMFKVSDRFPDAREIAVQPYVIFYKASDEGVTVLAIVHGSQKFPR